MVEHSAAYQAALDGIALYDLAACGRILLRDRDRAALLHRLSTNEIERLAPGQGCRTVLTTPIGRIIDLLTVYNLPDEQDPRLLLVTSPHQGSPVYKHLKKNIFFNDQLKLEGAGEHMGQLALYGPRSGVLLSELNGLALAELPLHAVRACALAGTTGYLARSMPIGGAGWQLFLPAAAMPAARTALAAAGAVMLDQPAYELLRIEQGYGAFGRELSLDYIPLEAGLWDAISFSKGCYVGQEIIARMESRGRLAKQLRGLRIAGDVEHIAALQLPIGLSCAEKEAGALTSLADSPRFGPIGLAYLRTAYAEPGAQVLIGETGLTGRVVELPFQ